jgi:shikimate kinase/3-dehydroquinate synthase
MARLLRDGPRVLASGGGAFMNEETRARIAVSAYRFGLKPIRTCSAPRAQTLASSASARRRPRANLRTLLEQRYPVYALADVTVISRDGPHELAVEEAIAGIECFLRSSPD